jgi:hypothetical protein
MFNNKIVYVENIYICDLNLVYFLFSLVCFNVSKNRFFKRSMRVH